MLQSAARNSAACGAYSRSLRERPTQLEVRVVIAATGEVCQPAVTTRDRFAKAVSNAHVKVEVTMRREGIGTHSALVLQPKQVLHDIS